MSKKLVDLIDQYKADPHGSYMSDYPDVDQWKKICKKISTSMRGSMKKVGFTDIKLSCGHKKVSGFARYNNHVMYLSMSADFDPNTILIRTAVDYNDYTGGFNHYIDTASFERGLKSFISSNFM